MNNRYTAKTKWSEKPPEEKIEILEIRISDMEEWSRAMERDLYARIKKLEDGK